MTQLIITALQATLAFVLLLLGVSVVITGWALTWARSLAAELELERRRKR